MRPRIKFATLSARNCSRSYGVPAAESLRARRSVFGAFGVSAAFASRKSIYLLLACVLELLSGCLVTDSLEESSTPKVINHAPVIDENSVNPKNTKPYIIHTGEGCKVELTIKRVIDEDKDDKLVARWFVDYDPEAKIPQGWSGTQNLTSGSPEPTVRTDTSFEYSGKANSGVQVVKVIISDGFSTSASPITPDEGRGAVSYTWTIDTTQATDCPP